MGHSMKVKIAPTWRSFWPSLLVPVLATRTVTIILEIRERMLVSNGLSPCGVTTVAGTTFQTELQCERLCDET